MKSCKTAFKDWWSTKIIMIMSKCSYLMLHWINCDIPSIMCKMQLWNLFKTNDDNYYIYQMLCLGSTKIQDSTTKISTWIGNLVDIYSNKKEATTAIWLMLQHKPIWLMPQLKSSMSRRCAPLTLLMNALTVVLVDLYWRIIHASALTTLPSTFSLLNLLFLI